MPQHQKWKKPTLCFEHYAIWNGSKLSWHILVVNVNSFLLHHLFVCWCLLLSFSLCVYCVLSTNDSSERNHHLICFCSKDYGVFACCSQMIYSRALIRQYIHKCIRHATYTRTRTHKSNIWILYSISQLLMMFKWKKKKRKDGRKKSIRCLLESSSKSWFE